MKRAAHSRVGLMVAMTAVIATAVLSGRFGHKSNSTIEPSASSLADQQRLLDYLGRDLRQALTISTSTTPWTMDLDEQGLRIDVPDDYHFDAGDVQHRFPVANEPIDASTTAAPYHGNGDAGANVGDAKPHQVVVYRFINGSITRTDPWQPLVADGSGRYVSSGPVTIAYGLDSFPILTSDPAGPSNGTVRYHITFHSTFQPVVAANDIHFITLHNVNFVGSKNLTP